MKRVSDFALWAALIVTGSWSAMFLAGVVIVATFAAGAVLLGVPAIDAERVGYRGGQAVLAVASLAAFVGVPTLARCYRVGFWRGLLAAGWLVLSAVAMFSLFDPVTGALVETILNVLIAVACAVILYRRRRRKRLDPQRIAQLFE